MPIISFIKVFFILLVDSSIMPYCTFESDEKEVWTLDAISVDHLSKVYGDGKKALDGISFTVKRGEIFSLLGPNGAGKSTLIHILTTFLKPTSGRALLMGKDVGAQPQAIRGLIASVAQKVSIDDHLSLKENMMFQSRLYGMDSQTARKRMAELIALFELKDSEQQRAGAFSGGIKRRLDIAMSMMSRPEILFLDEPTVGMDIESRKALWELVRKIKEFYGTTLFLTTHYLEEADALSDTVLIMNRGRELVQDTPEHLRRHTLKTTLRIELDSIENPQGFEQWLIKLPFVEGLRREQNTFYAGTQDAFRDFYTLNQLLRDKQIRYCSIGVVTPSLDDVFLSLIQTEKKE